MSGAANAVRRATVTRTARTLLVGSVVFLAAAVQAQPPATTPAQPPATERLLARADSITVDDYCRVAGQVLSHRAVIAALAADSATARLSAASICDPLLTDFSLRALRGEAPASLASIARVRRGGYAAVTGTLFDAMDEFRAAVTSPGARAAVRQSTDSATVTQLVRVTETAHSLLVLGARDSALARLRRYERKLGPTSARLNAPEVLLNYAAQRWVPGFGPRPLSGPGPLELVASYVPTYATIVDQRLQAVAASEFGIRWYLFGERFGAEGVKGLLFPSYWSAGALVVSDRNGTLVWPWEGRTRTGAFVSWGAIKVGHVGGRRGEWIVSRQVQIIPFVF